MGINDSDTTPDLCCLPSCFCTSSAEHFESAHLQPTIAAVVAAFPKLGRVGTAYHGQDAYGIAMGVMIKAVVLGKPVRQSALELAAKRDACDAWRTDDRHKRILRKLLHKARQYQAGRRDKPS